MVQQGAQNLFHPILLHKQVIVFPSKLITVLIFSEQGTNSMTTYCVQ
jgi:hypothetical protein